MKSWSREDLIQASMAMMRLAGWSLAIVWAAYIFRFSSTLTPIRAFIFGPETAIQIANAKEEWAQFGEFVGGILGPIASFLALVGLVFTILLQHEAMTSVQKDAAKSLRALSDQTRISLNVARLQALATALEVTSEMHLQAVANGHASAGELLSRKEKLADKLLEISDQLDGHAQSANAGSDQP